MLRCDRSPLRRCPAHSARPRRARCSRFWATLPRSTRSRRHTWPSSLPNRPRAALRPSGTAGAAKDVWQPERTRREREAAAALDIEACALDRRAGVARHVAATGHAWPDRLVHHPLELAPALAVRDHVLVEAQLAARLDHASQLCERSLLVGHRAEHE